MKIVLENINNSVYKDISMKFKIFGILFIIFLISSSSFVFAQNKENISDERISYNKDLLNNAFLKEENGVKILYTNGTYYEMGYQHGFFLKEEIKKSVWIFLNYYYYRFGVSYDIGLRIWNKTSKFFPDYIIEEMRGVADGSGMSFEAIAVAQTMRMKYHCSIISATGTATSDGKLYFARSLDWSSAIKDPITGEFLNNHVLFVRDPSEGYSSMFAGYSGFVATYGGINEKGISIAAAGAYSSDETFNGLAARYRMRKVLDHASTVKEAVDIISKNKTNGINFIISDSKENKSLIVEQTPSLDCAGFWNSPVESNKPCWSIENVSRRTNFFINKTLAKTQRYCFDPRNPINLLALIKPINGRGITSNLIQIYWMHYKALSKAIENIWGSINLFDMMTLLRDVYNGKNNLVFKLNNLLWKFSKTGYYASHQWVACPQTGEMLVSFAHSNVRAFERSVHYFNLFDILKSA